MHNCYAFDGGNAGDWRVVSMSPRCGAALESVEYIDVRRSDRREEIPTSTWTLHGQISNLRYATRAEVTTLRSTQEALGRPEARQAALIPIKKSEAWWNLAQDERRSLFEEQSQHTAIGVSYLPAIARQLYHCRDLRQPFDFLTWFEYAPENAGAFEELVTKLRLTTEWRYVEREMDIRLERYR